MSELPRIAIGRCRNPFVIEALLNKDYFDGPVCFFPRRLIHAAATWLAVSESVFFLVAESNGQHVGFVFSQTLGPGLWRSFVAKHLYLLPYVGYALLRRKIPLLRRKSFSRFAHTRPLAMADKVSELGLLETDQPFCWSPPDSQTVYVDLLSVAQPFRGHNLGCSLLQAMLDEVKRYGIRRAEAHIDYSNYASVRVFLRAGWNVVRTSTNDLMAVCDLETAT